MVPMVGKTPIVRFSRQANSLIIYVKFPLGNIILVDSERRSEIAEWVQLRTQMNLDDHISQPYPKATLSSVKGFTVAPHDVSENHL
jgi:hypothetical protein